MPDERWERIKEVVDGALELPPSERGAFLEARLGADVALRREAESLLAQESTNFLERPFSGDVSPLERSLRLETGARLGAFEVLDVIGVGGMGEVYRARDSKLGRDVAIKVLPKGFDGDEERLRRFEGEARLLAQLNHSNIATLHGLEEHEGLRFLVMELVDGETLAERIFRGPIPLDEVLSIFTRIAEALAAAHDKGIVHRDLKPSNVKLTEDGGVKLLDFGLAKAAIGGGASSHLPTAEARETQTGIVLGTAAYMSPEQARGQRVDRRTDIWSFGCCLYEALTGTAPFLASTLSDTIVAVLEREPAWHALPRECPSGIEALLRRCLEKDARRRLRDAWDVRVELESPRHASPTEPAPNPRRPSVRGLLAAAGVLGAVGLATWTLLNDAGLTALPVSRTSILLPSNTSYHLSFYSPSLSISPDGRYVAIVAESDDTSHLYLRPVDELAAGRVSGSEGARGPFFSPDSEWVGFTQGSQIMKVRTRGGGLPAAVVDVGVADLRGVSWGDDDVLVFNGASGGGLASVPSGGGEPRVLTVPDRALREKSHRLPEVLPGGKGVLFTLSTGDQSSWEEAAIAVYSLETGTHWTLVDRGMDASYSASGHVVYAREGTLFALPFDPIALEPRGTPVEVVRGVTTSRIHGQAEFAISRTGSLIYASGGSWAENSLVHWVERDGAVTPLLDEPRPYVESRLSPDGRRLALTIEGGATSSVWSYDLTRDTLTRVAYQFDHYQPRWSPDGDRLAFTSNRMGPKFNLYWTPLDGGETQPRVTDSTADQWPGSWTPDGQSIVFDENATDGTGYDIWSVSVNPEREPEPLLRTEFNEENPVISPDGLWMAYESDESGRGEVYVRPFRGDGGRHQVSTDGGEYPRWNPNGRELFYQSGNRLLAVAFDGSDTSALGTPMELFTRNDGLVDYDVAPDGRRFVTIEDIATERPQQLVLVQNWFEELVRLAPVEP